jgi:hypothetical protein
MRKRLSFARVRPGDRHLVVAYGQRGRARPTTVRPRPADTPLIHWTTEGPAPGSIGCHEQQAAHNRQILE